MGNCRPQQPHETDAGPLIGPRLCLYLAITLLASAVSANDPQQARVNLASDLATCAAYYTVLGRGNQRFENAINYAFDLAAGLSNVEFAIIRRNTSLSEIRQELGYNWANATNKYGQFCNKIVEEPETRLKYWLEKQD